MLTRWTAFDETFRTLDMLQRHFFDDVLPPAPNGPTWASTWPAVTLRENDEAFVLHAEVPGLRDGELSIVVENDSLVVSGERKIEAPDGYRVLVRERVPARFSRRFTLPKRVDADRTEAKLANGILTVTLPKASDARPRSIAVKVG